MENLLTLIEERIQKEFIFPESKITTILSGGMDSTTLLYYLLSKTTKDKMNVLSFNYGQKHKKELVQAELICRELGIQYHLVDLSSIQDLLKSSLTSTEEIPHGHYAEENMKQTVVPNRNAIMLSIAYGAAISDESKYLVYGAHTGDHFIYPDCRPVFVRELDLALRTGNEGFGDVKIIAPFSTISKAEIVTLGLKLHVPFEKTWSCYEGESRPCGKCGTCVERTEAFLQNDTKDPLLDDIEWKEAVKFYQTVKR